MTPIEILNYLGVTTPIKTYLLFALAVIGVIFIGYSLGKLIVDKFVKKKETFINLRKEVQEGYDGLLRAADSFHKFNQVLNEVQKNAKR